jgi:hypothetical protein
VAGLDFQTRNQVAYPLAENKEPGVRKLLGFIAMGAAVFAVASMFLPHRTGGVAWAQSTKTKANVKSLETRAKKAQAGFVGELNDLATAFEKAGDLVQSRQMLQAVARIDGMSPALKEKIDKLTEDILSENQVDVGIDVSKGWGQPLAKVTAGKEFRVQASGDYRFQVATNVGPEGFPTADPATDMAEDVPCGALMGMIVSNGRPDTPFAIGREVAHTPRRDGLLFIRVNVPPDHRCIGKVTARLGGYLETP